MIFEHLSKYKIILLIISIAFLIAGILFSPIIFQEGNPCPQIRGMIELNLIGKDIIELSANKYMTKSENGFDIIKSFMEQKGYDFIEQMGSGYIFRSAEGKNAVAVHKYYSRHYSLWKISEND